MWEGISRDSLATSAQLETGGAQWDKDGETETSGKLIPTAMSLVLALAPWKEEGAHDGICQRCPKRPI